MFFTYRPPKYRASVHLSVLWVCASAYIELFVFCNIMKKYLNERLNTLVELKQSTELPAVRQFIFIYLLNTKNI